MSRGGDEVRPHWAFWRSAVILFTFLYTATGVMTFFLGVWMKVCLMKVGDLTKESETVLPSLLMVFGLIVVVITLVSTTCLLKPVHLFVYSSTLLTLALLDLTIGGLLLAYMANMESAYERGLSHHMSIYTMDDNDYNLMDRIQITLKCCGNNEPFDWYRSSVEQIPPSCCKRQLCDPSNIEEIYSEGCFPKVYEFINTNTSLIDLFIFATSIIPMLGALAVFLLAYETFNCQYRRIEPGEPGGGGGKTGEVREKPPQSHSPPRSQQSARSQQAHHLSSVELVTQDTPEYNDFQPSGDPPSDLHQELKHSSSKDMI